VEPRGISERFECSSVYFARHRNDCSTRFGKLRNLFVFSRLLYITKVRSYVNILSAI
jgi:hypothetical protein